MYAFTKELSKTLGILPIDVTIGSKIALYAYFVIDSTASYNILLGRDLIHANWCVSSSYHQFLLFWKGNEVEVVRADKQPFMEATSFVPGIMIKNSVLSSSLAEGKMGSQGKHTWTQRVLWKSKMR